MTGGWSVQSGRIRKPSFPTLTTLTAHMYLQIVHIEWFSLTLVTLWLENHLSSLWLVSHLNMGPYIGCPLLQFSLTVEAFNMSHHQQWRVGSDKGGDRYKVATLDNHFSPLWVLRLSDKRTRRQEDKKTKRQKDKKAKIQKDKKTKRQMANMFNIDGQIFLSSTTVCTKCAV